MNGRLFNLPPSPREARERRRAGLEAQGALFTGGDPETAAEPSEADEWIDAANRLADGWLQTETDDD